MKQDNKLSWQIGFHIAAGLAALMALYQANGEPVDSLQQIVYAAWTMKYLLWAILFETVALQFK